MISPGPRRNTSFAQIPVTSRTSRLALRLAIVGARGIPGRYGGFETFAQELSVQLAKKGIDVTVYCEKRTGSESQWQGVNLRYIPSILKGGVGQILYDVSSLWDARQRFDVVYVLGYTASFMFIMPRLSGSKVWINMDGIEHARAKWSWMARLYLRVMERVAVHAANLVVADAKGIRFYLQNRYPKMSPCEVIEYGADVIEDAPKREHLTRWNLEVGGYYLLVCRIEPENHVHEIVEGFLKARSSAPLVMVGDIEGTKYRSTLRSFEGERVKLVGGIYERSALQSLRLGCKAYFHGHSVGGTNPSLVEALGCGNLIIAHDNVFNREVASDIAWYFNSSEDIPKIVANVEALSAAERIERGRKARSRVETHYNWERIVQEYVRLLIED